MRLKTLLSLAVLLLGQNTLADDLLHTERVLHEGARITVETTNTFTFYDYGEPTVRFHESVDKVTFSSEQSSRIYESLKTFYKTQAVDGGLEARLDTNYYAFVDDIIVIRCEDSSNCSLSYDQALKAQHILTSSFPKYQAGLVGDFTNFSIAHTVEDARNMIVEYKNDGILRDVFMYEENNVYLALKNGPIAGLLKKSLVCDDFKKAQTCKKSCNGSSSNNPDTKSSGTCIINFKPKSSQIL